MYRQVELLFDSKHYGIINRRFAGRIGWHDDCPARPRVVYPRGLQEQKKGEQIERKQSATCGSTSCDSATDVAHVNDGRDIVAHQAMQPRCPSLF